MTSSPDLRAVKSSLPAEALELSRVKLHRSNSMFYIHARHQYRRSMCPSMVVLILLLVIVGILRVVDKSVRAYDVDKVKAVPRQQSRAGFLAESVDLIGAKFQASHLLSFASDECRAAKICATLKPVVIV